MEMRFDQDVNSFSASRTEKYAPTSRMPACFTQVFSISFTAAGPAASNTSRPPGNRRAMAERFPDGRLVFDTAGPAAGKRMLKTWVKQAGIRDVGAYFSVRDAEKELTSWSNRISISSRGYMLGYQDLRGPGIRNIHRLLAGIADGPMKLQIVRMEFQARNGVSS